MNYKYLTQEKLRGFDKYKYSAIDTSPLSRYVMHPFWDQIVKIYPTWLAPNLLTFSGFLCLVANFLIMFYYDFDFYASSDDHPEHAPVPNWIWLLLAVNNFLYHQLDGTDGKQARRTKSSSPLGELFDHGLDSWATFLQPVALYSIFGRSSYGVSLLRFYFCLWNCMVPFILSHWEKYNTKVLFLPWGYDLSQLGIAFLYFITYWYGVSMWKFSVYGLPAAEWCEIALYVGSVGNSLPPTLWNIYKSYRDKSGKMRSMYEANLPLFSTAVLFTVSTIWVFHSPMNVLENHPRALFTAIGIVFSNITCRLIISQMTDTRCEAFNWLIYPLVIIVTLSVSNIAGESEVLLLWSYAAFVTLAHIHYGTCVVNQICAHLKIHIFSITKANEKSK